MKSSFVVNNIQMNFYYSTFCLICLGFTYLYPMMKIADKNVSNFFKRNKGDVLMQKMDVKLYTIPHCKIMYTNDIIYSSDFWQLPEANLWMIKNLSR